MTSPGIIVSNILPTYVTVCGKLSALKELIKKSPVPTNQIYNSIEWDLLTEIKLAIQTSFRLNCQPLNKLLRPTKLDCNCNTSGQIREPEDLTYADLS